MLITKEREQQQAARKIIHYHFDNKHKLQSS